MNHEQQTDIRGLVKEVIREFVEAEKSRTEPAYKAELLEERKRREQLEARVNELIEENKRSRRMAEEAERASAIRAELQRLGVAKIDLAFKAVKDDLIRVDNGAIIHRTPEGDVALRDYLTQFLQENPELLPARIAGGSGASKPQSVTSGAIDLDKIRPGMPPEELERARQEIARIASQATRL
jgi:hypothetical protein